MPTKASIADSSTARCRASLSRSPTPPRFRPHPAGTTPPPHLRALPPRPLEHAPAHADRPRVAVPDRPAPIQDVEVAAVARAEAVLGHEIAIGGPRPPPIRPPPPPGRRGHR